MVKNSPVSEDG